ncbi:MAG: methyltransferase [Saprospiraceae bacterium]|nr:methyltransferase [Saprospiraceae bacterium]
MKVGTDALLLGAWCPVAGTEKKVLDIGSGCGILSLLLAQRMPWVQILGVDIHAPSIDESRANASRSPWSQNVSFVRQDITKYSNPGGFDLIVSNPPYYNSQKPGFESRVVARHQASLTTTQLMSSVDRLLSPSGTFALVMPAAQSQHWLTVAEQSGLYPQILTWVTHKVGTRPKRLLALFSQAKDQCNYSELIIGTDQQRTADYRKLMAPYLWLPAS